MITGITTTTYQKEFRELMQTLEPKPDVWIIYNDKRDQTHTGYKEVFTRIANNYNKLKKLIPDNTDYVIIMEDDILYQKDIQDVYYKMLTENNYDILTIPVMHRYRGHHEYTVYPMVWKIKFNNGVKIRYWINGKGIEEVDASCLHYVFMKKEIIDKIEFVGVSVDDQLAIDEYFFIYAKKLGYRTHCNFDINTTHRGVKWDGHRLGISKYWEEPPYIQ